jgi:hypothetical protein
MTITDTIERPNVRFKAGDRAQLVHLPHRSGSEIKIQALVREVLCDGYVIDTENQSGIKVKLKDLRYCGRD